MRYLRNEDGIALVSALMFTLICLGMIMMLLYYVIAGTRMSAAQKRYASARQASYGGTDLITKALIPRLFSNYSGGKTSLLNDFGSMNIGLQMAGAGGTSTDAVLQAKLNSSTAAWAIGASRRSVDPKKMPDFIFTLKGQTSAGDFKVYSKIVDTVAGVGLVDGTGIDYLEAGNAVTGTVAVVSTPRTPTIYSIEVQGESAVNPTEKAALSVLYAF